MPTESQINALYDSGKLSEATRNSALRYVRRESLSLLSYFAALACADMLPKGY